ncbi:MAG: hypothetical protein IH876_00460, partial [Gemmatimonadetes bacterium]|nr:hypothetical protein [Gemmatimonadota bacterium]
MKRRLLAPMIGAALFGAVALGCEPGSITEAREQLGRGSNDTFSLLIPLVSDTFFISKILPAGDTVTLAGGVLGIRVQSDSVVVDVGGELRFDNLTFDQFTFSFDQMLQTQTVTTSVAFPGPNTGPAARQIPGLSADTVSFTTPAGSAVSEATIESGWVVRTMVNNSNCDATVSITLVDDTGRTVVGFADVPITAGATIVDSADAAGAVLSGFVAIRTSATFGICIPLPGSNVASDITFRPMILASVTLTNVREGFDETYGALDSEGNIQAVDTVVVATGTLLMFVQNRLPIELSVDVTLNGILDQTGTPLRQSLLVRAALGDGTYERDTLTFILDSASIIPGAVQARAVGLALADTAVITPTNADSAAVVGGDMSLVVERLAGTLDPDSTGELTVTVEEFVKLTSSDVDFEDLDDAIKQSTLNLALVDLSVRNDANIPLRLDSLTLGVARLDATGAVQRDPTTGAPAYELDASGNPLLVFVAPAGQTSLLVPRQGQATVSLNAAPLVDKMVKLLLDDIDVAFVTAGRVVAGDGTLGSISRGDNVAVGFDVTVGLDFTLPAGGIQFDINQVSDGIDLDSADADDLASRVVDV